MFICLFTYGNAARTSHRVPAHENFTEIHEVATEAADAISMEFRQTKMQLDSIPDRAPIQIIVTGCKLLKILNETPAKTCESSRKKPKKLIVATRLFERKEYLTQILILILLIIHFLKKGYIV